MNADFHVQTHMLVTAVVCKAHLRHDLLIVECDTELCSFTHR